MSSFLESCPLSYLITYSLTTTAIRSNRLCQLEALALRLGDAVLIESMAIAVKPLRINLGQQPVRGDFCEHVECMAQCFPCTFEAIQIANGR